MSHEQDGTGLEARCAESARLAAGYRSVPRMRTLLAMLAAGCCQLAHGASIGEGFTSTLRGEPARLRSRMFTIHALEEACADSPRPWSLEIQSARLSVSGGDRIPVGISNTFVVTAHDGNGRLIPEVPITLDVPAPGDALFYGQSALDYIEAIKAGVARIRVRRLCPAHGGASTVVEVEIRNSAPVTPGYCAYYIDQDMAMRGETWRFAPVNAEVMDWATRTGRNPNVTLGDFDRDGAQDTAFLMQRGGDIVAAVCLSSRPRPVQYLLDLYCEDAISTNEAGARFHDYELEKDARYPAEGVHVSCFERAGATYLYEDGGFKRVVDSD